MQNYPFKQLTRPQNQQQSGLNGKSVAKSAFAQQKKQEVPFGQPLSATSSSSISQSKLSFSAGRQYGGSFRTVGQNGAILANSSNQFSGRAMPGIGATITTNVQNHAKELMPMEKIDYNDSFDKRTSGLQSSNQTYRMSSQAVNSLSTVVKNYHTNPQSRKEQLFNSLNNEANNASSDDVESVHAQPQKRGSSGDCQIVESRPQGNLVMQFLGRPRGQQTLANRVYGGSTAAMRQMNAIKKPIALVENCSLLEAQERSMKVPVSGRPSSPLAKLGPQSDENMIELDDDSDTIDLEALEAALNAPMSQEDKAGFNRSSGSVPNASKMIKHPALLDRSKSSAGALKYGEFFSNQKSYFQKGFQQKANEQQATTSNLNAIDKFKQRITQKKEFVTKPSAASYAVASIRPLPLSAKPTVQKLNIGNPLLSGGAMGDYQLNRVLAKKRRETEEKQKKEQADEAAKLAKRMSMLKREAQKRKQRQENDEFDAIMGIPKPDNKKSKKASTEKQSNFAFLDDDLGEGVAALLDKTYPVDGNPPVGSNTAEQQAQIDADLIQQRREEQERRELEAHHKMIRFHNRNRVDELIQPILSLELVKKFFVEDPQGKQLAQIPSSFSNHEEYMDAWMPLFLFETYNQLISQKGASLKDREMAELLGFNERANRQFHFETIIEKTKVDQDYVHLRLFEADNVQGIDDPRGFSTFPMLQKMRENDLLILSVEPLEGARTKPVKKICNADFLMKMVEKKHEGIFLACVFHSRAKDTNYVDVRVDAGFVEQYFLLNQMELFQQQKRIHCYYFDSLTTIVREFLTIKKSEFYAVHDIILNPVTALQKIEANDQKEENKSADKSWKQWARQGHHVEMKSFLQRNGHTFNESQLEALNKVSEMHEKDLLLIQGPPGTGKTHTIHGIISMINSCQRRPILVCAPSNAAIDEIVSRISKDKFSSYTKDKILRVGAMDYEPNPDVKKHTLDFKLEQAIEKYMSGNNDPTPQERENNHNTGSFHSPANSPPVGSPNATQGVSKKAISTATLHDLSPDQKKKALANIQKVMLLLQRKEHTDQMMIDQIKPLIKDATQFDHFLKVLNRCQKIDQLDAIRKQLEPQKLKAGFGVRINASRGKGQFMGGGKPITKAKRLSLTRQIMNAAQIVCTTLSMSASEMFNNFSTGTFAYLIVDEACQSVELTNLIPFQHEPKKIILVGDQKQLPATVFSNNGNETRYSRSMFERFLDCGVKNYMLQIQYRMHPQIRALPSKQFYDDKLKDDKSVLERVMSPSLAKATSQLNLQPVMFFDLQFSRESSNETSKQNQDEVKFIKELLFVLARQVSPTKHNSSDLSALKGSIGIISPYKSQVRQIRAAISKIRHRLNLNGEADIEVNTVDGYQGREKDIIIISTVRTDALGFLKDYRRMNVAITRARHMLWIVGNERSLRLDNNWNALIQQGTQKAYHFTENPFMEKDMRSDYNNFGAMRFIEQTLMAQKVVPLIQAQKQHQQSGGVSYNDIFSPAPQKTTKITGVATKSPVMNSPNDHSREKETTVRTIRPGNLSHESGQKIVEKGVVTVQGYLDRDNSPGRQVFYTGDHDRGQGHGNGKRSYRERSPPNGEHGGHHNSSQRHHYNQQQHQHQPPHRDRGYQGGGRGGYGQGRGGSSSASGSAGGGDYYREGGRYRDNNGSGSNRREHYHHNGRHNQQTNHNESNNSGGRGGHYFSSKRQKY